MKVLDMLLTGGRYTLSIFVLALGLLLSGSVAFAGLPADSTHYNLASPAQQQEKKQENTQQHIISPALLAEFNAVPAGSKLHYWIILKDQVDTSNNIPTSEWEEKGQYVYDKLTSHAAQTQKSLLNSLSALKASGQVSDIHSYWIINSITVVGDLASVQALATDPSVGEIREPGKFKILDQPKVLSPDAKTVIAQAAKEEQDTSKSKLPLFAPLTVQNNIGAVGAPAAWAQGYDGTSIHVSSMDTGVRWTHQALNRRYRGVVNPYDTNNIHDYNWFDGYGVSATPIDEGGHGTHTMGTIVGTDPRPTGYGNIGVAKDAVWTTVRICGLNGAEGCSPNAILNGFQWTLAPTRVGGTEPRPGMRPRVSSNSWGNSNCNENAYRTAVQNWVNSGIFPDFATGNDGPGAGTVGAPASYPESWGTGNLDTSTSTWRINSTSSRGPSCYGNAIRPQAVAPGTNICSSVPASDNSYDCTYIGTSMAAPHIAGAVAIMLDKNPNLSVSELSSLITQSAYFDPDWGMQPNNSYGWGLLQVDAALSRFAPGGTTECKILEVTYSPNPSRFGGDLAAVDAVSQNDIWAVGDYTEDAPPPQRRLPLIEHWNGNVWSIVTSPDIAGWSSSLKAVAAVSSNDVWAVGSYSRSFPSLEIRTLIMHWDGSTWSIVSSPNAETPYPYNVLQGITALSANNIWAVGNSSGYANGSHTLIMHWDGSAWTIVPSENTESFNNMLFGVSAVSANDIWAVGYHGGAGASWELIMRWDGNEWDIEPGPHPGSTHRNLKAVTAVSADDVWAVGSYYSQGDPGSRTLIEHWDGNSWEVVSSPNSGERDQSLLGIAAISSNDIWAVGQGYRNGNNGPQTLAMHWDGRAWTIAHSANKSFSTSLHGVTALSASQVWAVGSDGSHGTVVEQLRIAQCPIGCSAGGNPVSDYAPVVYLHQNERYMPGTALNFIHNSSLRFGSRSSSSEYVPRGQINPGMLATSPYTMNTRQYTIGNGSGGYYLDLANTDAAREGNLATAQVYYDYKPCVSVTYWFHYPYNAPPADRLTHRFTHEGDWESIKVYLNMENSAGNQGVFYSAHNGGKYVPWNKVSKENGTQHPQVWTARGTHASYKSPTNSKPLPLLGDPIGFIGAHGDTTAPRYGGTRWDTSSRLQSVRAEPWYGFGGAWGQAGKFKDTTGPLGPSRYKKVGSDTWANRRTTLIGSEPVSETPPVTTPANPTCDLAWRVATSANVNDADEDNYLVRTAAISADDIWAIGAYDLEGVSQTLIEHWNGTAWEVIPSPNLGTSDNGLFGVAAISSTDVWAVGYYDDNGSLKTLIQHWDGTSWNIITSPNVGSGHNRLQDITAVSANDIWAVGFYTNNDVARTLTMHWNGTQWSVINSPNIGMQDNNLTTVKTVSSNDVWAVGYYTDADVSHALSLHWNGSIWSAIPLSSPGSGDSALLGVDIVSANNIWAVGYYMVGDPDEELPQTLIGHWDGSTWTMVSSPNAGSEENWLHGIAALGANDIWAVGYSSIEGTPRTLVQHWNGSTWSIVQSANNGDDSNQLVGIEALSATDVLAVGYAKVAGGYRTHIQRYNDQCACTLSPDYQATATAGATIVPGTTRVPGSICNSCSVSITLPFTYSFYGTPYSQVNVSNKGVLQFASNNATGADTCLPSAQFNDAIFAYWDDMNTNINDSMGIFTSVSGTAPNRIFNIEWRAGYVANDTRPRFEVRLYEGQPKFEVIYATTRRGFSATVGVQKGTGERFTQYACNVNNSVPNGTRITFDQRVCSTSSNQK